MKNATERQFHIGDLLSITSDRLVSPTLIGGVYAILDFMEGYSHWTHELPAAADRCKPALLEQHPFLAAIDTSGVNPDNWQTWLAETVAQHGEMHIVRCLPTEGRLQHPIDTLRAMVGDKPIVVMNEEGQVIEPDELDDFIS